MKINGREISGLHYEYVVIPRHDGDIVFKLQAIPNMDEFKKLCPEPQPPRVMVPGGDKRVDLDDAAYKAAVAMYGEQRYAYMVIKSLEATEGLEWDTVKITDPNTWTNWSNDLRNAGFTNPEINLIQLGMATANSMNQEKLDEARNRFLLTLQPVSSTE